MPFLVLTRYRTNMYWYKLLTEREKKKNQIKPITERNSQYIGNENTPVNYSGTIQRGL